MRKRERSFGSLVGFLGALVCLLYVVGLLDVARRSTSDLLLLIAPPVPLTITDRDASLAVTLVDEADHPMQGASARVFALRDGKAYFAGDRNTDAGGLASFDHLPRGEVWVLAYGAGRARASSRAVLEAGVRELQLVLRPARALDVVVVDEADQPVAGATIEVTTTDPLPYAARTSESGAARVDRLGPAPYRVRVYAEGFDEVTRTGVVAGSVPLRIRLERPATLDISVVRPSGEPAVDATVLVSGTGLWPPRSATANAKGQVRVGHLRGGVYDLKARLGTEVSRTELALPALRGETKEVTLTLLPGKRVHVLVTDGEGDDSSPIRDADVALVEEGISSFPIEGRTDASGGVDLGPIARTRAVVSARARGFVARTVAVPDDATEVKVGLLRGGVLVGDVVDDRGYPIAGATIEIIGVDGDGLPIDETSSMTDFRDRQFEGALGGPRPLIPMGELGVMPGAIPDLPHDSAAPMPGANAKVSDPWVSRADGTFRCEPVPPGRIHAIVRHPRYVEAMTEAVTIRAGAEVSVHVVLRQGGFIEGRVLEEDRTPVRGARIEMAAVHGSLERVTYAADDGTFTFPSAPDEVLLSIARPESPSDVVSRVNVTVPDRDRAEVEIVLPKLRETARIRVTDDRGYPVDRAEIRAVSLDVADPLHKTLFTDRGGDCTLTDSVGLAVRFVVVRPGKAPLTRVVDAVPRDLSLAMNEGILGRGEVTAREGRDRIDGAELTFFTSAGARHVRTDAEGAFSVQDLAPGRVRITVRHKDYAATEVVATIEGDRDHPAEIGAIELRAAGEVEGEVVDGDDRGVAGARVALDAVPGFLPVGPLPAGIVATDKHGRFTLGGLPEGSVALEAFAADVGRGRVEGVAVERGRTTSRVKITLGGGSSAIREAKGAGSVAVTLTEHAGSVVVLLVPPGSEAELAGIEPGDTIRAIDGHDVHGIEAARGRLTGPLGEDVVVTLRRDGEDDPLILRVRRERVRR